MPIPKFPPMPALSAEELSHVTETVFAASVPGEPSDACLVFGGSHPGLWETAHAAYARGLFRKVFATGGHKPGVERHPSWKDGDTPEAIVIKRELVRLGLPGDAVFVESRSTNSRENVAFAMESLLREGVGSLVCVCKNYGSGRQYRTARKLLPDIRISVLSFETEIDAAGKITESNWHSREEWKSLVWGEYLRILYYGTRGDILDDVAPPGSLQGRLMAILSGAG